MKAPFWVAVACIGLLVVMVAAVENIGSQAAAYKAVCKSKGYTPVYDGRQWVCL